MAAAAAVASAAAAVVGAVDSGSGCTASVNSRDSGGMVDMLHQQGSRSVLIQPSSNPLTAVTAASSGGSGSSAATSTIQPIQPPSSRG